MKNSLRLSTPKHKVLVFGPSHGAFVMRLLSQGFSLPDAEFTVFAINGSAFEAPNPVSANEGLLCFNDVVVNNQRQAWFSNADELRTIDLSEYSCVLYLDPLFILGGMMRDVVFGQGRGVCPPFLKGVESYYSKEAVKAQIPNYTPISVAQWLSIYLSWRVGTINALDLRP